MGTPLGGEVTARALVAERYRAVGRAVLRIGARVAGLPALPVAERLPGHRGMAPPIG